MGMTRQRTPTRRRGGSAARLLNALEVVYELNLSEESWVKQLTRCFGEQFGTDLGACGALRRIDDYGIVRVVAADADAPPGYLDATEDLPKDPRLVDWFLEGPGFRTLRSDFQVDDPFRVATAEGLRQFGAYDSCGFPAGEHPNCFLWFAGISSLRIKLPKKRLKDLNLLSIHAAAALRLRTKLARSNSTALEEGMG